MKKAAVVIGINCTGELPILKAAASGAQDFGAWLAGEGFEVRFFVDDNGPVTANAIAEHVTTLIDQGPPEQLVIYFAGHGFLKDYSEYWMLSEAPRNANEAIIVRETIELARESGVANVVIISDACRSSPQSLQVGRVRGSLIFPNQLVVCHTRPEIDQYFAALPGDPSLETVLDKSVKQYEGIFTHCFLEAYKHPDTELVKEITANGEVLRVVPNRSLKEYLRRKVPALMQDKGFMVQQIPDAIVESGDSVYLGRAAPVSVRSSGLAICGGAPPSPRAVFGVRDVARLTLEEAVGSKKDFSDEIREEIAKVGTSTGFQESVKLIEVAQSEARGHFETRSGFSITGAAVSEVIGLKMRAELLNGNGGKSFVRLDPGAPGISGKDYASSVILRFRDGSGTVLAGFENYIGTVAVESGRVTNVSYVPSENSRLWGDYEAYRPRLENLRAIIAAAAQHGVFRVNKENAPTVAGQIRYMKSIDPTLGLYAAYAYAGAGMNNEVRSVMNYMEYDLPGMLFDVAMLAGSLAEARTPGGVVPFCPMLSQGWTLLRVKRVTLPEIVTAAGDHLLPALWTTFDAEGMDLIMKGIRGGNIPGSFS